MLDYLPLKNIISLHFYKRIIMKLLASIAVATLLVGCGSTQPSKIDSAKETNKAASSLNIQGGFNILANIPYSKESRVDQNVIEECYLLGEQFSNSEVRYAPKNEISVTQLAEKPSDDKVFVDLSITDVFSSGNAFIGHRKSATVKGDLYVDGKIVASATRTRHSNGGFMGGFKGSCAVLKHTVNTLGNDIGKWLATKK